MRRNDGGEEAFVVGVGHVVGSTAKALRVKLDDGAAVSGAVWVPRSVLHDDSEIYDAMNNGRGQLVVKQWFATKEGWVVE